MTLSPTTIINGEYYYRVEDLTNSLQINNLDAWIESVVKADQIVCNEDDALVDYDGVKSYLTLYCQQ